MVRACGSGSASTALEAYLRPVVGGGGAGVGVRTYIGELPAGVKSVLVQLTLGAHVNAADTRAVQYTFQVCQLVRLRLPIDAYVDTLCITDHDDPIPYPGTCAVSNTPIHRLMVDVLAPHVRKVRVEAHDESGVDGLLDVVRLVTSRVMNICSLTVLWTHAAGGVDGLSALEALVRRVGAGLDYLELRFDSYGGVLGGEAGEVMDAQLIRRVICAAADCCAELKYFRYYGANFGVLRPLWKRAGRTLEAVYLEAAERIDEKSRVEQWRLALQDMRSRCRVLNRVLAANAPPDELCALLRTYGTQLRYAELSDASAAVCESLRRACPQAGLMVTLEARASTQDDFAALRALGPAVLRLRAKLKPRDTAPFARGLEHCTQVAGLTLVADSGVSLENVFDANPPLALPRLRALVLQARDPLTAKAARALARCTGELRNVILHAAWLSGTNVLHPVIDANVHLETLMLTAGRLTFKQQKANALQILDSAWRAPRIRQVAFVCANDQEYSRRLHKVIRNASARFRTRGTSTCILGITSRFDLHPTIITEEA